MFSAILETKLTLCGPVLSQATAAGAYGIDAPMARMPDGTERCYLPGTLVKGRLLEAWKELRDAAPRAFELPDARLHELLGRGTDGDPRREAARGVLHFRDFVATAGTTSGRHRVSIDPDRGAAVHGALQQVETPFAAGEPVTFSGQIHFVARDRQEAEDVREKVLVGLQWLTAFGALKSEGFGRLLGVDVVLREAPRRSYAPPLARQERLYLRLSFDAPFCVGHHQPARNVFESSSVIPGGALKGAVAEALKHGLRAASSATGGQKLEMLANCLDRIRFSHAFPVAAGVTRHPAVLPLSVTMIEKKSRGDESEPQFYDVALESGPVLIDKEAPAFDIDWKPRHWQKAAAVSGWREPRRELRVRTQIRADRRAAAEGQLFAYEMVRPEGFVWHATIDLGLVNAASREAAADALLTLLECGLRPIGKTKAAAHVELVESPLPPGELFSSNTARRDNLWVVMLRTPALLFDTAALSEDAGREELEAVYRATWRALSNGALELVRYFARQTLAGGEYLQARFRNGQPYRPYVLTEPGSVFVLQPSSTHQGAKDTAAKCINEWARYGLSLPPALATGATWQTCPYLRENGYGEIAANMPVHWEYRPPPNTTEAIKDLSRADRDRTR